MILGRDRHVHASCFDELNTALDALALAAGIKARVVLNAHAYPSEVAPDDIVYNLENVGAQVPTDFMLHRHTWDFSKSNVEKLALFRAQHQRFPPYGAKVEYVPVGYHLSMTRFVPKPMAERDIDVVFMGTMNARRDQLIADLKSRGANVHIIDHTLYGADRDALLARSRICLNIRFFEHGLFPSLRALHALSNRVLPVSELAPEIPQTWARFATHYDGVADLCHALLALPDDKLEALTTREFENLKMYPMGLPDFKPVPVLTPNGVQGYSFPVRQEP